MGTIQTIRLPKGNTGMTQLGTTNDDSTVTLPNIGFDFFYNGVNCRSNISVNGNSWFGVGSTTILKVSSADNSYNALYYAYETENGKAVFRIRFEGNQSYSNYGANNLVWELILYSDGTMVLVVVNSLKTGTDSMANLGGAGTASWTAGQSYVFCPSVSTGSVYAITTGSYLQTLSKYLVSDSDGIKHFDGTNWVKVGDLPLTEAMFRSYGDSSLSISRSGLTSSTPTLNYWSEDLNEVTHQIKQIVIPKPVLVKQITNYVLTTGVKSVATAVTVTGTSLIRIIVSVDSGATWNYWSGSAWVVIDSTNITTLTASTMTSAIVNAITAAQWLLLVGTSKTIRFGWFLKQVLSTESCNVNYIIVNFI